MASHTLLELRRAVAAAFDDLGVYGVGASSSTTVTLSLLADSTPDASANRYDGRWVFSADPQPQQRRVRRGGFVPATGMLTLEANWNTPPLGSEVDVTGLFPCETQVPSEDTSYRTLINRALGMLLVPDRLVVPITTDEVYPLGAWTWLDRADRLVDIRGPAPVGTRTVSAAWRGPELVSFRGAPALELRAPYEVAAGDLILEVLRPADTLISGYETPTGSSGFAVDTQTASAPLEEVVLLAEMEGCRVMMTRSIGRPDGADWATRYETARTRAERLFHFDGAFYTRQARAAGPEAA